MAAELKGARELSKQLQKLSVTMQGKALRGAAVSAALPILREAQARAPVNDRDYLRTTYKGRRVAPGFLKRNIARKTVLSKDRKFVKVMIGPKAEAFYGTQFVELGTSKMPARPWLRPAFEARQSVALSRLKEQLKKRIEKFSR